MRTNKCSQKRNKENKKMRIQLSDHFTYPWLLRFVVSPVLMMVFTSLYSIIDGFFVSNFVGKQPFAAVNLVTPIAMGIGTAAATLSRACSTSMFDTSIPATLTLGRIASFPDTQAQVVK